MLGMVLGGLAAIAAGGLIRGGGPKAPKFTKMPSPEDIKAMVDEITNTQLVTTKGADGKISQTLQRLPRTKEEEEDYQTLKSTVAGAMSNLRTLLSYNPENAERFRGMISALGSLNEEGKKDLISVLGGDVPTQEMFAEDLRQYKDIQTKFLDDEWRRRRNATEEGLIQNGHLDSSAANEMRANLDHQEVLARAKANMEADKYGRDIAQQSFENRFTTYNAGRLQDKEDYKLKEEAREQDRDLAKEEFLGNIIVEDREIAKQEKLLGHNQEVLDKEKAIEMNSVAPAMFQNMYNNKMAEAQGNNQVKQADYAIEKQRHAASARANIGNTLSYMGGKFMTQGFSTMADAPTGTTDTTDTTSTPNYNFSQHFKAPLPQFKFSKKR